MAVHPNARNLVRQMLPKPRPRSKRRRDTGPTEAVRDLLRARCQGRCERCAVPFFGRNGGDPHHRIPRGMGGTRDIRINKPSSIVVLCRGCHDHIESQRSAAMVDGWLVPRAGDPSAVPIRSRLHGVVLLDDTGAVTPIEGGAA